jgi:fructosamine-3-kinase
MDLAMLDLFGRVPARTAAAYEEMTPLADGWRERLRLWQLFPLLVHAVLFGGHYLRRAAELAARLA